MHKNGAAVARNGRFCIVLHHNAELVQVIVSLHFFVADGGRLVLCYPLVVALGVGSINPEIVGSGLAVGHGGLHVGGVAKHGAEGKNAAGCFLIAFAFLAKRGKAIVAAATRYFGELGYTASCALLVAQDAYRWRINGDVVHQYQLLRIANGFLFGGQYLFELAVGCLAGWCSAGLADSFGFACVLCGSFLLCSLSGRLGIRAIARIAGYQAADQGNACHGGHAL